MGKLGEMYRGDKRINRSMKVKQGISGRANSMSKDPENSNSVPYLENRIKLVHCDKNIGHSWGLCYGSRRKVATVTGVQHLDLTPVETQPQYLL